MPHQNTVYSKNMGLMHVAFAPMVEVCKSKEETDHFEQVKIQSVQVFTGTILSRTFASHDHIIGKKKNRISYHIFAGDF